MEKKLHITKKENSYENLTSLYDFYDKVLNCLVVNAKTMTNRNNRRGFYITDFSIKDKKDLLLVEVVKITNMITSKSLPILIDCNNLKTFIQLLKMKFKLRKTATKIKKAKPQDINNDFDENLDFVRRALNFPMSMYEDIYHTYYEEGIEIPDLR